MPECRWIRAYGGDWWCPSQEPEMRGSFTNLFDCFKKCEGKGHYDFATDTCTCFTQADKEIENYKKYFKP